MGIHIVPTSVMAMQPEPITIVVNKYKSAYDVYIGRGSLWGNPFTVEEYGRGKCIELYRPYIINRLLTEPALLEAFRKLEGKRLGCFCKPQPCHGDVLVDLLKRLKEHESTM